MERRWRELTGPTIAERTRILSIEGGTLTVGICGGPLRAELEKRKRLLVESFGPLPGNRRLRWLRFELVPADAVEVPVEPVMGRSRITRRSQEGSVRAGTLSERQRAALAAFEGEGQQELRDLFEAWMRSSA